MLNELRAADRIRLLDSGISRFGSSNDVPVSCLLAALHRETHNLEKTLPALSEVMQ